MRCSCLKEASVRAVCEIDDGANPGSRYSHLLWTFYAVCRTFHFQCTGGVVTDDSVFKQMREGNSLEFIVEIREKSRGRKHSLGGGRAGVEAQSRTYVITRQRHIHTSLRNLRYQSDLTNW